MNKIHHISTYNDPPKATHSNLSIKDEFVKFSKHDEPFIYKMDLPTMKPQMPPSSRVNNPPFRQMEFQNEKGIEDSFDLPTKDRAQSVFSQHQKYVPMEQSYVTVHNVQKQRLNKFKIEKDLYNQEEINAKRAIQIQQKKKGGRKNGAINLIRITNNQEDFKSVKMEKQQTKVYVNEGKQSVKGKNVSPAKQEVKSKQISANREKTISEIPLEARSKDNAIHSIIELKLEPSKPQFSKKSVQILANEIRFSQKIQPQNNSPLRIQHTSNAKENLLQTSLKSEDQSPIQFDQSFHRGLTNSFFYGLHTKIDEIQLPGEQFKESSAPYRRNMPIQQSQTLVNTKMLLKELNQQLNQIGLMEPEQDSNIQQPILDNPSIVNNQVPHQPKITQILIDQSLYESREESDEPREQQRIQQTFSPQKRVPQLNFRSSLIDYQIVQNAPRVDIGSTVKEKQQLHEEIDLLKQVISELKVERLKYQTSLNSERNEEREEALVSHSVRPERYRFSTPNLFQEKEMRHKITRSNLGNYTQSIVAEFNPSHFKPQTNNFSGKIVRNISSSKKREERQKQKQEKQEPLIRQEVNETDMRDVTNPIEIHKIQHVEESNQVNKKESFQKVKLNNLSQLSKNMSYNAYEELGNSSNLIPLINHSIKCESNLQSSLIKPTKIEKKSSREGTALNESGIRKKLLSNFEQMERQSQKGRSYKQQKEPKFRANNDGIFKDSAVKHSFDSGFNKIAGNQSTNNLKSKIMQNESLSKGRNSIANGSNIQRKSNNDLRQSKSTKGFRVRQESQVKSSRIISGKSCKSNNSNLPTKKQENAVYLSPRSDLFNFNQSNLSPKAEKKLYQVQFNSKEDSIKQAKVNEQFTVGIRNVNFNLTKIPILPQVPNPNTTIEVLSQSIKELSHTFHLGVDQSELSNLIMKKYKNCVIVDLPNIQKLKLVWYYSGKLYIGDWNETSMIKSGEGMQYIPGKYYYKGQFLNDKRNGSGNIVTTSGSLYEGQWFQGEKNGRGKFYDSTIKLSYQGEWKSGKKQGYGYFHVENQSTYQGAFSQNFKSGFGTEQFITGDAYRGEYSKGRFHGKGKYVWANGDYYEGQFFEGCKNGKGKLILKIGEIYAGHYKSDRKSGRGRYMWLNGCIYDGEFEDDKKNGNGYLTYPDGREVRGCWRDDKLAEFELEFSNINEKQKSKSLAPKANRVFEAVTSINVAESRVQQMRSSGKIFNF